jgi:hypothetical protein
MTTTSSTWSWTAKALARVRERNSAAPTEYAGSGSVTVRGGGVLLPGERLRRSALQA